MDAIVRSENRPARLCFFGDFDQSYNRNKMLIEGARRVGAHVQVCHTALRSKKKYLELWRSFRAIRSQCDAVVLGFSDDRFLPFVARLITWGKLLVWDTNYSVYDNWVFDRRLVRPRSLKALYHWLLDWCSCRCVDVLILDFDTHIAYFGRTFGVPARQCIRVNGSADTSVFHPLPVRAPDNMFHVEYHGKYIPVQGVDVIIRAAKLLMHEPNIRFTLIGDGQEAKNVKNLAASLGVTNVEFLPFLPLEQLPPYIAAADVCMGLIGDVPRVARTVANKVYEAAAMGRVSINADVPAIREIFTDGVDVVLVRQGDPEDLAKKILMLKHDPALVARLSTGARSTFERACSPEHIGQLLVAGIQQHI